MALPPPHFPIDRPTFCARTSQESRKEEREKAQKVVDNERLLAPRLLLDAPQCKGLLFLLVGSEGGSY